MPRADRRGGGPDRAVPPPGDVPPGRALWAGWGRLADLPDSTAALHRSPIEALGLQAPLLANMSWVRPSGPALCSSTPPVKNLPVIPVIPVKPPRACEHSLRPSRVDQRQGRFYWYYWYYWQKSGGCCLGKDLLTLSLPAQLCFLRYSLPAGRSAWWPPDTCRLGRSRQPPRAGPGGRGGSSAARPGQNSRRPRSFSLSLADRVVKH